MPLIEESKYHPTSFLYKRGHLSTIYSAKIRNPKPPDYKRERLELPDGDFLDLDYLIKSKKRAVLLCHGLEGSSRSNYNNTAARYFLEKDYSVFAWNNRSCSGEMNRLPRLYHHGEIRDLDFVVQEVLKYDFEEVFLLGFSMGAAQIMNYLGTLPIDKRVKAGMAVSAPIHLKSCSDTLKSGINRIYLENFLIGIKKKLRIKSHQFPDLLDWSNLDKIKSFDEVDEYFTAPMHGYAGAEDYYHRASPAFVRENIQTPLLVLNALNDPFLGKDCFPRKFAQNHEFVFAEIPEYGGHCAFSQKGTFYNYSEEKAYEFFNSRMVSKGF